MKKTILISFLMAFAMLFVSCSTEPKEVKAIGKYSALLYANSAGVAGDTETPRYTGDSFLKMDSYRKEEQKQKEATVFGKKQPVYYSRTVKYKGVPYELDMYECISGNNSSFVFFRSDTDKIAKYQTVPTYRADYVSPVSAASTDEEFLAYANVVLAEYAGVSTEGWETTVGRGEIKWHTDQGYYRAVDGRAVSVSESEYEELADSIVKITYTKKIGGIERSDQMMVAMTDAGEIVEFNAINYEDGFKPFLSIKPDPARIEEAAWQAFGSVRRSYQDASAKIDKITLIPQNNSLWARVIISYTIGNVYGGVEYVIEVARLE